MSIFFLKALNMSIAAGWLILAICVLRQVFRKAPKRIYPIFWAIVAVRLICPSVPESSFSLIPNAETVRSDSGRFAQEPVAYSIPHFISDTEKNVPDSNRNSIQSSGNSVPAGLPESDRYDGNTAPAGLPESDRYDGNSVPAGLLNSVTNNELPEAVHLAKYGNVETPALIPSVGANPMYSWLAAGSAIWLMGIAVMLCFGLHGCLRLKGRMREAVWLRDNIWLCDAVKSPFVLGLVKPRIYLPSELDVLSGSELMECILAHEKAHLKSLDHWWKLLGYLLLAVYWFHPLVWAAYILFCRDIEFACDERVIKNMDLEEKKKYSDVLLMCSMQKKMVVSYPLSFGEVSIKARVGAVLNYRRPAFWTVIAAVAACVVSVLCFLTNPKNDAFDIRIVIPANSGEAVYYSEEEISPYKDRVTLFSGEGLGDTAVVLKPTAGCTKEDVYEPVYMTAGFPVEMYAEKGGWFKIGVTLSNPTEKDITVYVRAEGVEVRIADSAGAVNVSSNRLEAMNEATGLLPENPSSNGSISALPEASSASGPISALPEASSASGSISALPEASSASEPISALPEASSASGSSAPLPGITESSDVEAFLLGTSSSGLAISLPKTEAPSYLPEDAMKAIQKAILEEDVSSYPELYDFACCDFVPLGAASATPLAGETTHIITYYGWVMNQKYLISEDGIETVSGSHIPTALTFTLNENGYQLKEIWRPREGSYFAEDIRREFPSDIADDGIDSQKYGIQQIQSCYQQAVEYSGLDTAAVIENLLDTICSEPKTASNPQAYIEEHFIEYRELIYYGEYTLRYCFGRFEQGNETGLEGKIMAMVCEELLQSQNVLPITAGTAETGQCWYDALAAQAGGKENPNP